jgi:hypothetical protein
VSSQHIGAAGELLVQYLLLKGGIDSARLTTDSGIDLVAYAPETSSAVTIQVKTQERPLPAGGKGALALGYTFPHALRAELLALVDLSTDSSWLFSRDEALTMAQQRSPKDIRRLYWYLETPAQSRLDGQLSAPLLEQYRLSARIAGLISGTDDPGVGHSP